MCLVIAEPVLLQAHSFELEADLAGFGSYAKGGIVTQHKHPKTIAFRPLAEALQKPGEFLLTDFSKIERPGLLHIGFQALDAFQVGVTQAGQRAPLPASA